MIEIKIGDHIAYVDDEDKDLAEHHWYLNYSGGKNYAMTHGIKNGRGGPSALHRIIAERVWGKKAKGMVVGFHTGDPLHCVRCNLISSNRSRIAAEQGIGSRNTTGYKGVSKMANGKYRAYICYRGASVHLGTFETAEDAADEYDYWARCYFGSHAFQNRPNRR